MSDIIYRQDAIDGLSKLRPRMINTREQDGDVFLKVRAGDVNDMLKGLPPAEPEHKTGRWVGARQYCRHLEEVTGEKYSPSGIGNMIYCDQCWKASDRKSNYCPDCGAKMDKE